MGILIPISCRETRDVEYHLRQSLQGIFRNLECFDEDINSDSTQLLTVRGFGIGYGRDSAGIGAILSPLLCNILLQNPEVIQTLPQTMLSVHSHVSGTESDPVAFEARFKDQESNKILHLGLPSGKGGCWLSCPIQKGSGKGVEINSHNCDYPKEQWAFLAALVTLSSNAKQITTL